jgi:hypothetical protein
MKTNVKMEREKFQVKDGVVVSVLKASINPHYNNWWWWDMVKGKFKHYDGFTVIGKAEVGDLDIFDEEFGKRLASSRAQQAAFLEAKKFFENLEKNLETELQNVKNRIASVNKAIEVESKRIHKLSNNQPENGRWA